MTTEIFPEVTDHTQFNYRRADVAVCFRADEQWGELCNCAPGYPLEAGGVAVRTAEALYQALKFSRHPGLQEKILAQSNPEAAAQLARDNRGLVHPDFPPLRVAVMWWVLRVRLAAHPRLGEVLAATGSRSIVKLRCDDLFWGAAPAGEAWLRGQNIHGRLVVRLRELRRENGAEWARAVEVAPAGLRLLGRELGAFSGPENPAEPVSYDGPPASGSASPFAAATSLFGAVGAM
jgi:ribA/ribD-fused uncharacterized protein